MGQPLLRVASLPERRQRPTFAPSNRAAGLTRHRYKAPDLILRHNWCTSVSAQSEGDILFLGGFSDWSCNTASPCYTRARDRNRGMPQGHHSYWGLVCSQTCQSSPQRGKRLSLLVLSLQGWMRNFLRSKPAPQAALHALRDWLSEGNCRKITSRSAMPKDFGRLSMTKSTSGTLRYATDGRSSAIPAAKAAAQICKLVCGSL